MFILYQHISIKQLLTRVFLTSNWEKCFDYWMTLKWALHYFSSEARNNCKYNLCSLSDIYFSIQLEIYINVENLQNISSLLLMKHPHISQIFVWIYCTKLNSVLSEIHYSTHIKIKMQSALIMQKID